VRAQVDRDLTTVGWVDRLLGLIKNLGHHNLLGLSKHAIMVIEQLAKTLVLLTQDGKLVTYL
jgi:hypothetical protein